MATNSLHLNPSGARRLLVLVFPLVVAAALSAPQPAAASYGWPIWPFHDQHPVRGFFGDPRIGLTPHGWVSSFHFGVDISAPDGAPVYATLTGVVELRADRPETVSVRGSGGTVFEYWHVVPTVRAGQRVTAYRTVLGRVARGEGHVHFSELQGGVYVNPLRRGALAPYIDRTAPTIRTFGFERDGRGLGRKGLAGRFDLVVEAVDETPLAVAAPWNAKPVTPALVCWRIVGRGRATPWRIAADFRRTIPSASLFGAVYARWTRQNKPWRYGRYRILLARGWDSASVPDGTYRLEVEATDTRGNRALDRVTFGIRNR
jgi:hypothetical protein